jgi:hypothetical protein
MRVPFTTSDQSITVFVDGKVRTVLSGNKNFHTLRDHLKGSDHDVDLIIRLSDREATVRSQVGNSGVTIEDGTVYYRNEEIHNSLTDKLLDLLDEGFNPGPWIKFLENLMSNPSFRSRSCLYDFLSHFNAPITPDGKFIAFKRVGKNWKDIHSGTMDNSVGRVVEMDRHMVDDDPQHTCSSGLHVCADEYLKGYATADSNRTLAVEVDPADVVAVPYDYNFSKMRVCRYKVLCEIDPKEIPDILSNPLYEYF